MAETTTTTSTGFLSGVTDLLGSVFNNASGIADLVNAATGNNKTTTPTTNLQYDQYGRLPGQAGYGTSTPPASGIQATTGFASLSTGAKVGILGGIVAAGIAFFYFLTRKKR